jgi:hypothetical protein
MVDSGVAQVFSWVKSQYGINLSDSERKALALKLLKNAKLLHDVETSLKIAVASKIGSKE